MILSELLIRLFVKDYRNTENEAVRNNYGVMSGIVGIAVNVLLSTFKMIFGSIAHSIAIVADGVNNLFDAISSIINLIGFKISGKPADKEHPFGYGRTEYISALTLAFFILFMGFELIKTSVGKFKEPSEVSFSIPAVIVLVVAILMKIWLAAFNRKVGKAINSVAVDAVVADSIGDIAATTCSLVALVASRYTSLPLDAAMGIIVALVIMYAGFDVLKSTMGPLLGEPPEKETIEDLEKLVMSHDGVVGIHDVVLHGYGHSKVFGSLHAEVPSNRDIMESHDLIDCIEQEIREKMKMEISIHMDPILVNDERTDKWKKIAFDAVKEISEEISIHDFRVVDGPTHTNLIFDAVLPYSVKMTEDELRTAVNKKVKEVDKRYFVVMNIDREYV